MFVAGKLISIYVKQSSSQERKYKKAIFGIVINETLKNL